MLRFSSTVRRENTRRPSGYFSTEYKDVVAFGLLILILLFRPSGILGRPEVEKV